MSAQNLLSDTSTRLSLSKYSELACALAVYPATATEVYPALGLCDEVGEVYDKYLNLVVNDDSNLEMQKELGDVCWYVFALANDCAIGLQNALPMLQDIDLNFAVAAQYSNGPYDQMIIDAALIAGYVKKQIRDNVDRRSEITQALVRILRCIAYIASDMNSSLEQILLINLEKLYSRKERGTLKGDGDNR